MGILNRLFGGGKGQSPKMEVPRCSVCMQTSEQVIRNKEAESQRTGLKFRAFGHLVGICPSCNEAFCIYHAPYDHSIAVDSTVCPEHKVALDFDWDRAPDKKHPWRVGH